MAIDNRPGRSVFFMPRTVQNVLHGGEKVPESPKWDNYLPVEASIPDSTVSLESILCTEQLLRRPWRPPDYKKENRALVALASALMDPQSNILQTLADTILDVTRCDSSGLSLLTKDGKRFYWPAIAGNSRPSQNEDGIFQSERGLGKSDWEFTHRPCRREMTPGYLKMK